MGAGKASFPTKPVICRDTILAPKLELQCRERVICRVGNSLQVVCEVGGKPSPKVTWDQNNHELKSEERIRVKNVSGFSTLAINDAIRSDSGIYHVKAENVAGCKSGKVEVVVADKPSPVCNLDVVEVTRENVILRWEEPEDDGGESVSNYVVEKKDMQRMMWLTCNNACLKNEIRISKLRENGEFQFRVMAENSYGLSDPVDTPTVLIRDRYKTPDAPDGVRAKEVFKDHVLLEWNKPYDGGKRILNYRVEKRETQTERWVRVTKELITEPKYIVKELLEGNEYEFRVMAENSIGYSVPSVPSKPVICHDPVNPPSMPINIGVIDIKGKTVTVQWSPPRHNGGASIDGYIVETNKVGTDMWKTWCTPETQKTCIFTIPDLTESFEYYIRIKAVNMAGTGEPGVMRDTVVVVEKMSAPDVEPNGNMTQDRVVKAGTELVLSATIKGTPAPTIRWIKNDPVNGDKDVENKYCHKSDNQVKMIMMEATRNMTGRYTLLAENSIGKKSASCHVSVLDIPSQPRDIKINEVHAETLRMSWKQPSDNGGTVIAHYRVERIAKGDGNQHWKPIALAHKKTNIEVKYLIEGETYKFRVFAENCFGMGAFAETEEVVARNPIHAPSIPQNLEVVDIDREAITLAWQKPGRDGGSPVTAYRIEYCTEEEVEDEYGDKQVKQSSWETFKTVSTFKCTVTGLKEGIPHKFRVRAANEAGEGRPDTTLPITPTQKLVPPNIEINVKILEGLTVRAGSTITIPAMIRGVPSPTLVWANAAGDALIGGEPTEENPSANPRIEIQEDASSSILLIKKALRADSGEYSLSAKNDAGAKSVVIHCQVLDAPGQPIGPIEFEELTPEYAVIVWNPPKDDGGNAITNYIIEKAVKKEAREGQEEPKEQWQMVSSKGNRTKMKVPRLISGKTYLFRV
jgi:titin